MRRRPAERPRGWRLDGIWYDSEREYVQALAARSERRRRLLARVGIR